MCAVEECDPWDVYNETHPVARKEHHCCECRRTIRVGERYYRMEGAYDGKWSTYKVCQHCDSLGNFMRALCEGWPFGWLHSELVDHWREGYASIPLGRLIAGMRLQWHDGADPVPSGCGAMASDLMRRAVA